ncbi:MAG: glycosyltransferase family 4 protein [bacterium]
MKIFILTGIFPPDVGGPATYVPRLARACQDRGHDIEVLTLEASRSTSDSPDFDYPVHRWSRGKLSRLWQGTLNLPGRVRESDCVYVNGLEWEHTVSRWNNNTPSVQKIVGDRSWERYRNNHRGDLTIDEFQSASVPFGTAIRRRIQHWMTQLNDRVIVPSHYLKSIVSKWGMDPDQIDVVYNNAHEPPEFDNTPIEWPGSGLQILNVGRLVPWKRVPDLIQTVSELNNGGMIVLGDGPERQRCEEAKSNNNVEDRVHLKGNVDRPTVFRHLSQCDVLVLHSTYEGFPHILLEALATGTPVLASASGGTRELAEFFPEHITTYPMDNTNQPFESLQNESFPDRYSPPDFPDPLQWDTIVDQTIDCFRSLVS